jgi:hypothetical protein
MKLLMTAFFLVVSNFAAAQSLNGFTCSLTNIKAGQPQRTQSKRVEIKAISNSLSRGSVKIVDSDSNVEYSASYVKDLNRGREKMSLIVKSPSGDLVQVDGNGYYINAGLDPAERKDVLMFSCDLTR